MVEIEDSKTLINNKLIMKYCSDYYNSNKLVKDDNKVRSPRVM